MDENECPAVRFEEHRAHLRGVAYRMLGSLSEADHAVQDTWLRLIRPIASMVVHGVAAVEAGRQGAAVVAGRPGHPAAPL